MFKVEIYFNLLSLLYLYTFSLSRSFRLLVFSRFLSLLISVLVARCWSHVNGTIKMSFCPHIRNEPAEWSASIHAAQATRTPSSPPVQIFEFISTRRRRRRLQWNAGTRWLSSMSNHLYLRTHHVWWTKPSQAEPSKNVYALDSLDYIALATVIGNYRRIYIIQIQNMPASCY